ncbi:MAG: hypothetical protein K2N70_03335, partial [Helicobacter sp.]|nr:hypothetical protein [Helicobacter sp.]
RKKGEKSFQLGKHCYFNSGLLLLHYARYCEQDIEKQCLAFIERYKTAFHDQDALNAVLAGKVCYLPFAYNCMPSVKADVWGVTLHFAPKRQEPSVPFVREEYEDAVRNPKIAHFVRIKPWKSIYASLDKNLRPVPYPHRALWWEVAAQTPVFSTILLAQKDNFEQDFAAHIAALQGRLLDNHKRLARLRAPWRFISSNLKKLRFWRH